MENTDKNLNHEEVHSSIADILEEIKQSLGLCLCAESGHGKSYSTAQIIKTALLDKNLTVIVLSPSKIWARKLWSGYAVKVGDSFNPIIVNDKTDIENVQFLRDTVHINLDKKYSYVKSKWLEDLLRSKQSILFDILYKNGRRIKAFESVVLEYIYNMQSEAIDRNPEYAHHYLVVLEEAQNAFGTYSMNSDDSLELFTIFTQSRSDALVHYLVLGQRLNDISCKVVERLKILCGLTLGENSLRKLKSMIPDKATKTRIQSLPRRHWIYLDGKTNPEITIPEFKKEGSVRYLKPIIPKAEPKTEQKNLGVIGFFKYLLNPFQTVPKGYKLANNEESENNINEDSKGDFLMLQNEDLIFSEE